VLRLDQLAELGLVEVGLLEVRRRHDVGRRVHRLLAQDANARVGERRLVAGELRSLLPPPDGLPPDAALDEVGVVDVAGGCDEALGMALGIGSVISFLSMIMASKVGETAAMRLHVSELLLLLGTAILMAMEPPLLRATPGKAKAALERAGRNGVYSFSRPIS